MGNLLSLQVRIDVLLGFKVTMVSFLLLLINDFTIKFWFVFLRAQTASSVELSKMAVKLQTIIEHFGV